MMPYVLLGVLLLAGLAAALAYLVLLRGRQQRQRELLRRLRSSNMYAGVYALFRGCERRYVERVELRPEEVVVVFLRPEGDTQRYVFDDHGIDPLGPEMLYALAQAAAVDVPCLQDGLYYRFDVRTLTTLAGRRVRYYTYTMKEKRKDYLLHSIRAKNRQMSH